MQTEGGMSSHEQPSAAFFMQSWTHFQTTFLLSSPQFCISPWGVLHVYVLRMQPKSGIMFWLSDYLFFPSQRGLRKKSIWFQFVFWKMTKRQTNIRHIYFSSIWNVATMMWMLYNNHYCVINNYYVKNEGTVLPFTGCYQIGQWEASNMKKLWRYKINEDHNTLYSRWTKAN